MFLGELIITLIIALILSGLFILTTLRRKKKAVLIRVFPLFFLTTWAGVLWIRPIRPSLSGIHLLSFLLAGLIIVLIVSIKIPRTPPSGREETLRMLNRVKHERELKQATFFILNILYWILIVVLIVAIIAGYLINP
jgi:small-conductance mechanosensitive channel